MKRCKFVYPLKHTIDLNLLIECVNQDYDLGCLGSYILGYFKYEKKEPVFSSDGILVNKYM